MNFFKFFLGDLKTPKGHFEINWPLDPSIISRNVTKLKYGCVSSFNIDPCPLSICTWFLQFSSLKYPVWWTRFFPSLNWIFLLAVACKIQVWNKLKIKFIKLDISNWRITKIKCRKIGGLGLVCNSNPKKSSSTL